MNEAMNKEREEEEYSSIVPAKQGTQDENQERPRRSEEVNDPSHSPDIVPGDSHEEIND